MNFKHRFRKARQYSDVLRVTLNLVESAVKLHIFRFGVMKLKRKSKLMRDCKWKKPWHRLVLDTVQKVASKDFTRFVRHVGLSYQSLMVKFSSAITFFHFDLKVEGCNKMTCPTCGKFICYICRSEIPVSIGYQHFCQTPHCQHKHCRKCPLYSNAEEDDLRASREAGLKAVQDLKADGQIGDFAEKLEHLLGEEERTPRMRARAPNNFA